MKRTLLILLFVAFAGAQANAQRFSIIPKVGVNFASVTNSNADTRVGLNVGVAAEMLFTDKWGVEPGIFYSMQGYKADGEGVKLDYINIPIYIKYYVYKGLNVFTGPQLGFNVKAKFFGEKIGDLIKTADLGMGVGIGYQFNWGMMVSGCYTFGFTNITKLSSAKNGIFQVNTGWRF